MSIFDKLIDSKWHAELVISTNKVIAKEYEKYVPYYNYILDFIKKNKCLISSMDLLNNKDISLDKPIQIYVLDPYTITDKLFRELCKKFGKNIVMQIDMQDKHYSISMINKRYINISYIDQHDGISLLTFLKPVEINGYIVLPPILELIDLYKNVYNPEKIDDWDDIIEMTPSIQKLSNDNIQHSVQEFKGGKECKDCSGDDIIKMAKESILTFLKKYKDYVLVHKPNDDYNHVIISKNNIQTDYERINNYLVKEGFEFIIIFKKKNIFISKDYRINKFTLYVSFAHANEFANMQRPFLDIYNNSKYELVPYYENNDLIMAHPWIEIRFYYIEIWNLFASFHMKIIKYDDFAKYTKKLLNDIDKMNIDWKTAPTKYTGVYINEFQAFKQVMLKNGTNMRLYC
jgi:hypothetical protein